jgi:thymidylate synthase (FAD)
VAFKENEMTVQLMWATQNADFMVAKMARVSNPDNQNNAEFKRLLNYLMKHNHVSPFEMASMCVQVDTTRDISRQILRHRSFSFQEFSGRYEDMTKLGDMVERECRLQDTDNRQSSLDCSNPSTNFHFNFAQSEVWDTSKKFYDWALSQGIAKEQARALLPEGLTPTRLYMTGTIRSWLHYIQVRAGVETQKEHRIIAQGALEVLRQIAPITAEAFFGDEH